MNQPSFRRLTWITGINGFTICGFAALATCASSLLSFSWPGLFAGLAVTVSAFLEVLGHYRLKAGDLGGIRLARLSQKGVFLSISLYCLYQLSQLNPTTSLDLIPDSTRELLRQLYQIDTPTLSELLMLAGQITYLTVMLASLLVQGGLYWYYGRQAVKVAPRK